MLFYIILYYVTFIFGKIACWQWTSHKLSLASGKAAIGRKHRQGCCNGSHKAVTRGHVLAAPVCHGARSENFRQTPLREDAVSLLRAWRRSTGDTFGILSVILTRTMWGWYQRYIDSAPNRTCIIEQQGMARWQMWQMWPLLHAQEQVGLAEGGVQKLQALAGRRGKEGGHWKNFLRIAKTSSMTQAT